jgi:flavodoxin
MNTLVLYDSQFGNTEQVARTIAQTLSAYGRAQVQRVDTAHPSEIGDIDLLVLGCPTQGWRATPAMRAFLSRVPNGAFHGVAVACFDTRFDRASWLTGSAAQRMAGLMKKWGVPLIAPPESFFVEATEGPLESGELSRAERWAEALLHKARQSDALQHVLDDVKAEAVL